MRYSSLIFLLLLVACSSPRTIVDYDLEADFDSYQTYAILPGVETRLTEFDEQRLISSISNVLREEGLSPSRQPDLYVDLSTNQRQETSSNRLGIGIGGGGGNIGIGIHGGIPLGGEQTYLDLVVELIDARNNGLVWEGRISSSLAKNSTPEERKEYFDSLIQQLFSRFPPDNGE